jgi:hypothetical protein
MFSTEILGKKIQHQISTTTFSKKTAKHTDTEITSKYIKNAKIAHCGYHTHEPAGS